MFDQFFKQPKAIQRYHSAPLFEDRLRYLNYRAEQQTARAVLRQIAQYQLVIIKYLCLKKNKIVTIEEIKNAANRWKCYEMHRLCPKNILTSKKKFIRRVTQWLYFLGWIEIPKQKPIPIQITEFFNYMRNEKGLAESSLYRMSKDLKKFFSQIKEKPDKFLANVTPRKLDRILIENFHKGKYSRCTIQIFSTTLRSFFRYAEYRGWCQSGIADSIKAPRIYKHESLPLSPSWENVQRLIKTTTEGNRPSNIRDRAILLLLSVYGLRDSEVRQLKFENFDWEKEKFYLKRSKCGPTQTFPLVQTVGESLLNYIKKTRPRNSSHREIFLTIQAPFRPLDNLNAIVYNRWKPLNVGIKFHGPHSLRHACATRLINQGIPLKTIADQLGHRSLESTRIYAKVDLSKLREVANLDLGGLI